MECLLNFFFINSLVELAMTKQAVDATEIGALKGIVRGKAIETPTIPNSESVIKISVPIQAFDNLTYLF